MVECVICGKETANPKKFGGEMLCRDCYDEWEREYFGGCRCSCK